MQETCVSALLGYAASLLANGVLHHLLQARIAPVAWLETSFGLALQAVPWCGEPGVT